MESLLALLLILPFCHGHMSMQFPYPRDSKNGVPYAKWQANEPMIVVHPQVCHGLDKDTTESTVRVANQFSAGDTITIDIYGSVPHGGGHCTFWYSTDDKTFTKIIDIKDCTLTGAKVMLPTWMPTECEDECTFAFSWVPALSGGCEIYMNCADISVSGVTGGNTNPITKNFQTEIIDQGSANSYGCQRVDPSTHWTPIFMPLKLDYDNSGANSGTGTGSESSDSTPSPTIRYTPSPVAGTPSPTIRSSPSPVAPSGNGILITNRPGSSEWWYTIELTDIPSGIEIESVWMKHADSSIWEEAAWQSWATSVWSFYETAPFEGPFDFRMRSTSGLEIESIGVLQSYTGGESGRMSETFDSGFSVEEGSDMSNPVERALTWVTIFIFAWCIVCVAAAFCMRKRQKRQSLSEMQKMSTAVDETHEMTPNEIEVSVIDGKPVSGFTTH